MSAAEPAPDHRTGSSATPNQQCSEAALAPVQYLRQRTLVMNEWMDERLMEAQAVSWKVAIVREVHGSTVDSCSIDDLLAEYDRMRETIVIVKHEDGMLKRMSELYLRLACTGSRSLCA